MGKNKEKRQPIKVYVRVRPLNDSGRCQVSHIIVECSPNTREVVVNERPGDKITRTFTFDKVFGPTLSQLEVYRCVASPLIQEVLDGYNCTIFAYGQTGAGKTYTIEGQVYSETSMKRNHNRIESIIMFLLVGCEIHNLSSLSSNEGNTLEKPFNNWVDQIIY